MDGIPLTNTFSEKTDKRVCGVLNCAWLQRKIAKTDVLRGCSSDKDNRNEGLHIVIELIALCRAFTKAHA